MAPSHVSNRDKMRRSPSLGAANRSRTKGVAHKSAALRFLKSGLRSPGGKLPLFDEEGQRVDGDLMRYCVESGLAETWFVESRQPDLPIYRITEKGCAALGCRESLLAALVRRV